MPQFSTEVYSSVHVVYSNFFLIFLSKILDIQKSCEENTVVIQENTAALQEIREQNFGDEQFENNSPSLDQSLTVYENWSPSSSSSLLLHPEEESFEDSENDRDSEDDSEEASDEDSSKEEENEKLRWKTVLEDYQVNNPQMY